MTLILSGEAREADIYYRCGWDSDVHVLYVEDEEKTLHVPGFEYQRAKKEISGVRVENLTDPKELLEALQGPFTVKNDFPHSLAKHLQGDIETKRTVFEQRRIKSEKEIQEIKEAQDLARRAIELVTQQLTEAKIINGVAHLAGEALTSEQLKMLARTFLIQHGADCPDLIISSAEQTALPHHRGTGPITQGPVIIDIFPQARTRYHGDMTRTVILGEHPQAQKYLRAVTQVHEECIKKCVPGQDIKELFAHAETRLAEHGFATDEDREHGLVHSLGHGLGLSVHEAPNLGPRTEGALEEGMVVTIEPGLYYDVGVRHEDTVVVGEEPRIL